jgi:hypothetical protein
MSFASKEDFDKLFKIVSDMNANLSNMNVDLSKITKVVNDMNVDLSKVTKVISSDHPIYYEQKPGVEGSFFNVMENKVAGISYIDSFCEFLIELEHTKIDNNFISFTPNSQEFLLETFDFPKNQMLFIRDCYQEIANMITKKGIFLVSGSPSTGKTMFIVYHMKKQIKRCIESNFDLVFIYSFFFIFFFFRHYT